MKYFFTLVLLLHAICICAQINVIEHKSKPSSIPIVIKYDSLTNISRIRTDSISFNTSYNHLIGQTVYYVEPDTTKYRVHHIAFYQTNQIAYRTPTFPRKSCMNRYWKITNIIENKNNYGRETVCFEMTDTTDGKVVYCDPEKMNRDFIVLGYYEKIKKMYVGKSFIYQDRFFSDVCDNDRYNYLINYQTKEYNKEIPENSIWRCVDIGAYNITNQDILDDNYECRCPIILLFENDSLGMYYAYVQNKIGRPFNDPINDTKYCFWITSKGSEEERLPLYLGKFLSFEQQEYLDRREKETKQYFATRKKKLVAKYGKYWGNLVAEGQLEIGMTKQMCLDSWGEPDSINKTSTRYGNHEQWIYSTLYVYFENGKIIAIQDR